MKKILQIAAYDFRRIMLNPITMIIMGILMIGCLIFGVTYSVPPQESATAVTIGSTGREIFQNFNSTNLKIDTQKGLHSLLTDSQTYLQVMQEKSPQYDKLLQIKAEFDNIKEEFDIPIEIREPKYIQANSIKEIAQASIDLADFVSAYEILQEFECKAVFTVKNFETLKEVSDYFFGITRSGKSVREIVLDIYQNKDKFTLFSPSALVSTWQIDAEKLDKLQEIVTNATAKADAIYSEMEKYANLANQTSDSAQKVQDLILSYKLTCQYCNFVVKNELKIAMTAHFGDLDKIYGYTKIGDQEDLRQDITKATFLLSEESLYCSQWQEPLNFNTSSSITTAFDQSYLVLAIVGFLAVIFGIFCAYKLFGRDRRNGKIDIILSQNVPYGQVFAGKFLAIVFCTTFALAVFLLLSLLWSMLFYPTITTGILAVFNLTTPYIISPILFLLLKFVGIELQVIFWAVVTIFLMNISRKFELTFAIALLIFAATVVCNLFLNQFLVYCLFPFMHTDLTAFLGGGSMHAGFLQTTLYTNGNFFISLAYYVVVVVLLYNFTNQLFKKN